MSGHIPEYQKPHIQKPVVNQLNDISSQALSQLVTYLGQFPPEIPGRSITGSAPVDIYQNGAYIGTVSGINFVQSDTTSVTITNNPSGGGGGGGGTGAGGTGGTAEVATDATPGAINPGGTAGGDLSGTYPNPSVVDDSHSHGVGSTVTGLGTNVAAFLGTPSSANLAAALTDETGTGAAVFATSATLAGNTTVSQATFLTGIISPTQLTSDVNDYAPTGFSNCTIVRQDVDATGRAITGLAGGASGRLILLINIGASGTITLKDQSASSTATNRFRCPNNTDMAVRAKGSVLVWYDGTSGFWKPIGP